MPYGLTISPSVFQAFANDVLWDMIGRFVVVFMDNILIYSVTHVNHVRQVLQGLLAHQLGEKCISQEYYS